MIQAERILVRGPNWAGDLIMATPGFRALRSAYPEARIALHVRAELRPLIQGSPWFDRLLSVASYHRGPVAQLREGLGLRRGRFDLGLCLTDSFSSALLMRFARVDRVVGYAGQGRSRLLDLALPAPGLVARERHVLGLVEALGCPSRGTRLELFATGSQTRRGAALLEAHGVGDEEVLVALAPGASYGSSKLWPLEHFAAVGDALADSGARVLLVGSPAETPLARRVAARMRAPAVDLTSQLDLGLLKVVIGRSRVVVCNDAGARHVAVALGVPCVVLFGPTSLAKTNLNLERVRALAADVGCRPCYQRRCPIDHRCMTRLDPARVTRAARSALEGSFRGDGALRAVPGGGA
ncbi:MAG: lipopolysaccharide heptosyltransferase II [Myxococcota bacterium]|nr:lipopolysaccharide heptosyltransferase II [Myxococcota bacterium]